MDAAQMMMPLIGAVPATAPDVAGMVLAEQPLAEQFSQLLGDAIKNAGATLTPASELLDDNQESVSSPQPETPVIPATDSAMRQMMASFVPALQPAQSGTVEFTQPKVEAQTVQADVAARVAQPHADVLATMPKTEAQVGQPQAETQMAQPKVETQAAQPKPEVSTAQPRLKEQVAQPRVDVLAAQAKVETQAAQPQAEAQTVQPRVEMLAAQAKAETQVVQPKLEVQVAQPKAEAQIAQPKVEVQVAQPQAEAQTVQPRVEILAAQAKAETQVVQPKLEVQVAQPKLEALVAAPKAEAQIAQPKVEVQVAQPKVEAQVVQPKVEAQVVQPKTETPVEQTQPKQATEWWSYGHPVTTRQLAGLQAAASPDPVKHAAAVEKPVNVELLQAGSAQEVVAAPVAGAALAMDMNADSNPQGKAFSEGMAQHHALPVSTVNQRSEGVVVEKSAENLRQAVPEQVSRQVTDRLATHDFKQGKESLSLTLTPEHLGKIQMNFQMDQQNLRVEIVAENRVAREALMQQVDSLKESLARQNVTVEKFEVTTGGKEFQQQYQQPQQQQALYSSLYDRQGATRNSASNLPEGDGEYQAPEGMQYFAPQYESTFTYRA